jgi:hypothetical protein
MWRFPIIARDLRVRWALLAALAISYFGSLWVGALHYPNGYDWKTNVISNLLSPRDNPHGYWLPSAGVALAAIWMAPLAIWIESELGEDGNAIARRVRRGAFLVGIVCLMLAAVVVPQHVHEVLGMRHAHEMLARTAAAALGLAMLGACKEAGRETGTRAREFRTLRRLWQWTILPTLLGAIASGLVVGLNRWTGAGRIVSDYLRGTIFWHLAFWEWAGSIAVFLFFAWPVIVLRPTPRNELQPVRVA